MPLEGSATEHAESPTRFTNLEIYKDLHIFRDFKA